MRAVHPLVPGLLCLAVAIGAGVLLAAQQLPSEPRRDFGVSITGALEGWFENADGSRTFLVGYFNRNANQTIEVPIGPNNRMEPGGPDIGQPTHFLPGRQYGMFTVTVPKEFAPDQRITWTLVVNGQTTTIPLRLVPEYVISPFVHAAVDNTPPVVRFGESAPAIQGPVARMSSAAMRTTTVSMPLALTVFADDDARFTNLSNALPRGARVPVQLRWSKYRGPGTVTFEDETPDVNVLKGGAVNVPFSGKATTTARFSEPGDYALHLTALDSSGEGGGGELCCWTTAIVRVTVSP